MKKTICNKGKQILVLNRQLPFAVQPSDFPSKLQRNPNPNTIPLPSDSPDTCISLAKCICKQSGFTFGYHGGNRDNKHRKNQNQTEDKQPRMTDSHIH